MGLLSGLRFAESGRRAATRDLGIPVAMAHVGARTGALLGQGR